MANTMHGTQTYFYYYTNNNNLRHFLSNDAIISKNNFETEVYNRCLGDYFPWGVLLLKRLPSAKMLGQFFTDDYSAKDYIYPIVLKLDLKKCTKVPALLLKSDDSVEKSDLSNFKTEDHKFAIICGCLPFSFVDRIFFRDQDEKRQFTSTKTINIEFDQTIMCVEPEPFTGDFECNIQELEKINSDIQKSEKIDTTCDDFYRRNKIRGSILASIEGFKIQANKDIHLHFDKVLLNNIRIISGVCDYSVENEFDYLLNELEKSSKKQTASCKIDKNKIKPDNSPFVDYH